MEKKVILDRIEIKRDGNIDYRFKKLILDDDGSVISDQYHRAGESGDGLEAVNNHLEAMKAGRLDADELQLISDLVEPVKAVFVDRAKPKVDLNGE